MSQRLFDKLPDNMPIQGRHIILHVKIKPLLTKSQSDYATTSLELIKLFSKSKPKSIIIPTFTYSFTKSLDFNLQQSPSETGRFSEEIRLSLHGENRTKDPIFSVVDYLGYGFHLNNWNINAFDKNSIWNHLEEENALIINIGLDEIVSTHLHFLEQKLSVPYRKSITFNGNIHNGEISESISYKYFARDLTINPKWDRKKLLSELKKEKIVNEVTWNSTNLRWFNTQDVSNNLSPKIQHKPEYLLKSN